MPEQPQEQPVYILPQNKKRVLVPKILSLILLGGIFYAGILLNISLLQLSSEQQSVVNLTSLIFLLMILALGFYLGYHQVSQPYRFYPNRIMHHRKLFYYSQMTQIIKKQNTMDKLFKTYSLDLGNKQRLENIPQEVQIDAYLQQLINYSKNGPQ